MPPLVPAAPFYTIVQDSSGNLLGVTLDGSVYRLETYGKLKNVAGSAVNPATEDTLSAIKSTDGIKKIVDALPAGDNLVGKVKLYDAWGETVTFKQTTQLDADDAGIILACKDDEGKVRFIRSDRYGNVATIPSDATQATFGETRTSETFQLAEYTHKYKFDTSLYGTETAGSGAVAHTPNSSAITLSVTGASGDKEVVRTHTYHPHQAGRGILVRQFVYCSDVGQTNQVREWGYADNNDGIFWRLSGTSLYIVIKSSTSGSPAETTYSKDSSEWSVDNLNGSGPSGITLDVKDASNYEIRVQWPVGVIYFYVDGVLVHKIDSSNYAQAPVIKTPNLPLNYKVENTGASSAGSLSVISACVTVEGGENPLVYPFGASTDTGKTVGTTEIPILSIRPKQLFNSIENRMLVRPIYAVISTEEKSISFRLIADGTLTSPSWTSVSSDSGVEYDITASAVSGGLALIKDLVPVAPDYRVIDLKEMFNYSSRALRRFAFASDANTLTITAANRASASTTLVNATYNWHEVR